MESLAYAAPCNAIRKKAKGTKKISSKVLRIKRKRLDEKKESATVTATATTTAGNNPLISFFKFKIARCKKAVLLLLLTVTFKIAVVEVMMDTYNISPMTNRFVDPFGCQMTSVVVDSFTL